MRKILVIEDEQIERDTLIKILQDSLQDIEIYAATNGMEALELYEKKRPSIVLADINIPLMSGLDVIKRIKTYQDHCEFLILSSYDYFHYAQEAIRLGVEDFILKPYKIQHLIEAVEHIIQKQEAQTQEEKSKSELLEKIEKYTPIMENECFFTIMSNGDELTLKQKLSLLDPHLVCGFCVICENEETQKELQQYAKQQGNWALKGQLHGEYILFILFDHWMFPDEKEEMLTKFQTKQDVLQLGSIEEDIHIYESYCMAKKNGKLAFANRMTTQKQIEVNKEEIIQKLIQAFDDLEEERVKQLSASFAQIILSKEKEKMDEDLQYVMDTIYIHIKESYDQQDLKPISTMAIVSSSFQEVTLYVVMNIMKYYQAMVQHRFKNTNQLVRQALKYIDANYCKPITLNDMAEYLHVSPFYISKLLNASMKKTFTELISERRVEASKELLKTNKRIKEIAYEVGFQGQNYFTKIFKKYTGVTPKVYKNTFESSQH